MLFPLSKHFVSGPRLTKLTNQTKIIGQTFKRRATGYSPTLKKRVATLMTHSHQPLLSNHCSKENSKRRGRFIPLNKSSSAFRIKHFVATIFIYLGTEIIFKSVSLHPAAGKLQLSLCRACISSGYSLPSKQKEIVVFLTFSVCLGDYWGRSDENLETSIIFFVCFFPAKAVLSFPLCFTSPAPSSSLLLPLSFSQSIFFHSHTLLCAVHL